MRKTAMICLILTAIACFAIAVYYPISYFLQEKQIENDTDDLMALKPKQTKVENESTDMQFGNEIQAQIPNVTPSLGIAEPAHEERTQGTEGQTLETSSVPTLQQKPATTQQNSVAPISDILETEAPIDSIEESTSENTPNGAQVAPIFDKATSYNDISVSPAPETTLGANGHSVQLDIQSSAEPQVQSSNAMSISEATLAPNTTLAPNATLAPNTTLAPNATLVPDATATPEPMPTLEPTPTPEPVILEECKELLELNSDYIGWLTIENTGIDYPVVQTEDEEYYLTHNFYGDKNYNGQLILSAGCDVKAPSYHLIINGHNMRSGKMFANLQNYGSKQYWERHKTFEFNSIYRYNEYVIYAVFYTKEFEEGEKGFRYNVDINYAYELNAYLDEIDAVKRYDTGIDIAYGDELITLSTCSYHTENGRFVVVARKVREGEAF